MPHDTENEGAPRGQTRGTESADPGQGQQTNPSTQSCPLDVVERQNFALNAMLTRDLSKFDLAVLAVVIARVNGKTGNAFVSMSRIQSDAGCSRPTVVRSIKTLCSMGFLHRLSGNTSTANTYRLGNAPSDQVGAMLSPRHTHAPMRKHDQKEVHARTYVGAPASLHVGAPVNPLLNDLYSVKELNENSDTGDPFNRFWSLYPRKEKKRRAEQAWASLAPDPATVLEILSDVMARVADPVQWKETRFIPQPDKYIADARWRDEWTPADPAARRPDESRTEWITRRALEADAVDAAASGQLIEGEFTTVQRDSPGAGPGAPVDSGKAESKKESELDAATRKKVAWLNQQLHFGMMDKATHTLELQQLLAPSSEVLRGN